jgi:hypothetical protein
MVPASTSPREVVQAPDSNSLNEPSETVQRTIAISLGEAGDQRIRDQQAAIERYLKVIRGEMPHPAGLPMTDQEMVSQIASASAKAVGVILDAQNRSIDMFLPGASTEELIAHQDAIRASLPPIDPSRENTVNAYGMLYRFEQGEFPFYDKVMLMLMQGRDEVDDLDMKSFYELVDQAMAYTVR